MRSRKDDSAALAVVVVVPVAGSGRCTLWVCSGFPRNGVLSTVITGFSAVVVVDSASRRLPTDPPPSSPPKKVKLGFPGSFFPFGRVTVDMLADPFVPQGRACPPPYTGVDDDAPPRPRPRDAPLPRVELYGKRAASSSSSKPGGGPARDLSRDRDPPCISSSSASSSASLARPLPLFLPKETLESIMSASSASSKNPSSGSESTAASASTSAPCLLTFGRRSSPDSNSDSSLSLSGGAVLVAVEVGLRACCTSRSIGSCLVTPGRPPVPGRPPIPLPRPDVAPPRPRPPRPETLPPRRSLCSPSRFNALANDFLILARSMRDSLSFLAARVEAWHDEVSRGHAGRQTRWSSTTHLYPSRLNGVHERGLP